MPSLPFVKMSGAGNDFILIDAAEIRSPRSAWPAMARRLCDRRRSVGADGLLVLRGPAAKRLPSLDYYNADGSEAFCGNGSRCAAWFIHHKGWVRGRHIRFDSIEGTIDARVTGSERVRVQMPPVRDLRMKRKVSAAGKLWTVHSLNTGVPHAVVETSDLDRFPVVEVGRALRRHQAFAPAGTNVDFIQIERSSKTATRAMVRLRTYERGVEDETLACGTGAVASAVCAHLLKGLPSPVRLLTRGGDHLLSGFRIEGDRILDAWLEGPARITFQGTAAA